jgi:hypothetical protein
MLFHVVIIWWCNTQIRMNHSIFILFERRVTYGFSKSRFMARRHTVPMLRADDGLSGDSDDEESECTVSAEEEQDTERTSAFSVNTEQKHRGRSRAGQGGAGGKGGAAATGGTGGEGGRGFCGPQCKYLVHCLSASTFSNMS